MKTNFSVLFYMKKPSYYKGGAAPIYMRLTVDSKRTEISTGRECLPERWNSAAGRGTGTKEEIKSLNAFLESMQAKVYEAHDYLYAKGIDITADAIKKRLAGEDEDRHLLIEGFADHNRKMASLVGKDYAEGTLERYGVSLRHTQEFIRFHYGIDDMDVRKVNNEFISEYDYYLRSVRKCANNSTVKYMKNFGKIMRICFANGWITSDPFAFYKGRVKNKVPVFLLQDELDKIAKRDFSIERLSQVRDIFLFCCYTGLAYADVKKLKMDQIQKGVDGKLWIIRNRQKTDVRSAIPLLPVAEQLLDKYKKHSLRILKGMPLPVPSNQKMNEYLRK